MIRLRTVVVLLVGAVAFVACDSGKPSGVGDAASLDLPAVDAFGEAQAGDTESPQPDVPLEPLPEERDEVSAEPVSEIAPLVDVIEAASCAETSVDSPDVCPVAVIHVGVGGQVIPQTMLHLDGEGSHSTAGPITHYEWEVEQPSLSASVFVPTASYPSPAFEANVVGKYVFKLNVWDACGHKSCVAAEEVVFVAPNQAIHIELLWTSPGDANPYDEGPTAGTDLDLHLAHPNAAQEDLDGDGAKDPWFDPTWDCFWFYPLQNWGSVSSTDDNPNLDRDDVDGNGPENMNLAVPEDGKTYRIGVNYWDDHGFGHAFATVRVYIYGTLAYEVTNVELAMHDLWWVATLDWPGGVVTTKLAPNGGYWIAHDYHHPLFYQPSDSSAGYQP